MEALINLKDAQAQHQGAGVPSPCVSICELDEARGRCKGCYRTLQEIAGWGHLPDQDKLAIWKRIEARQLSPTGWEEE